MHRGACRRRARIRASAACAQARHAYVRKSSAQGTTRRHAMWHARGARRRHSILEHASPVLGSDLGKKVDPGEARPARARPGTPGGAGRGALVSAPKRPCQPWLADHLSIMVCSSWCCIAVSLEFSVYLLNRPNGHYLDIQICAICAVGQLLIARPLLFQPCARAFSASRQQAATPEAGLPHLIQPCCRRAEGACARAHPNARRQ